MFIVFRALSSENSANTVAVTSIFYNSVTVTHEENAVGFVETW